MYDFFLEVQRHEEIDLVVRENVNDEHSHLLHLNNSVNVVLRPHHRHQVGLKNGKNTDFISEMIICFVWKDHVLIRIQLLQPLNKNPLQLLLLLLLLRLLPQKMKLVMINNQILDGKINRNKRFFLFLSFFKDLKMMIQIKNIQKEGQKNKCCYFFELKIIQYLFIHCIPFSICTCSFFSL